MNENVTQQFSWVLLLKILHLQKDIIIEGVKWEQCPKGDKYHKQAFPEESEV